MTCTRRLVGFLLIWLVIPVAVFAQAVSTATIGGTVRDASGGVLPGVSVNATHTDTRLQRTVVTDENGSYLITNLPVGPYRLEFSLQGFRTAVQTASSSRSTATPRSTRRSNSAT